MTPERRQLYDRCYALYRAYTVAPTEAKRRAWEKARREYAGEPAPRPETLDQEFEAAVKVVQVLEELDAGAAREAVLAVWRPGLSPQDAALLVHKRAAPNGQSP